MLVVVILLSVAFAVAVVVAIVLSRRATAQRKAATAAAEELATRQAVDAAAREAAERARADADERATAADAARSEAETQARLAAEEVSAANEAARLAEERAVATEAEIERARQDAEEAAQARRAAEHRADEIERRVATLAVAGAAAVDDAPPATGELDAQVVWALERSRTERTWRQSVALGPTGESILASAEDPLLEALQIELDAAREEVGAVVDLEAALPSGLSAAASLLVLRTAQELLADVVRRSESTTLRVLADGADVVVTVEAEDEDGRPVLPAPLPLPPNAAMTPEAHGVRLRNVAATPATPPTDT